MVQALSKGKKTLFFASVLCGYAASMFAIAGSSIFVAAAMTAMDGLTLLGLAFTLESLFRCVMIPLSAKLGERYLRRNLFMVGLLLFSAGGILCAVAWDATIVLIARAVMGLAWGLFFSNIVVMLSDVYPPEVAPKMNGFMQTLGFVAVLAAAPVAGLFVDFLSWQWALYVTVALALLSFLLMLFVPNMQEKANDGKRLDVGGAVFLALVLIPFSLALSWGGTAYAWGDPVIIGLFAAMVVFLVVLVVVERKAEDPIFPSHLFGNKNYMMIFFIGVCFSAICSSSLFLPTILQQGIGVSATESSLPVVANSLVCIVSTSFVGTIFAKSQKAKALVAVETALALVVGGVLFTVTAGASLILVAVCFAVLGVCQAVHQVVTFSYPSVAMSPSDIAVGVAFISFGQICAGTVFNAVLGALMNVDIFMPLRAVVVFAAVMVVCVFFFKDKKAV